MAEGNIGVALAPEDSVAELLACVTRLATGPQWLHASGSGLPRPCDQQVGQYRPRLPAAGRQLPTVGRRPLSAQSALRQCGRRRQARSPAMVDHGSRRRALQRGPRRLAMGK